MSPASPRTLLRSEWTNVAISQASRCDRFAKLRLKLPPQLG